MGEVSSILNSPEWMDKSPLEKARSRRGLFEISLKENPELGNAFNEADESGKQAIIDSWKAQVEQEFPKAFTTKGIVRRFIDKNSFSPEEVDTPVLDEDTEALVEQAQQSTKNFSTWIRDARNTLSSDKESLKAFDTLLAHRGLDKSLPIDADTSSINIDAPTVLDKAKPFAPAAIRALGSGIGTVLGAGSGVLTGPGAIAAVPLGSIRGAIAGGAAVEPLAQWTEMKLGQREKYNPIQGITNVAFNAIPVGNSGRGLLGVSSTASKTAAISGAQTLTDQVLFGEGKVDLSAIQRNMLIGAVIGGATHGGVDLIQAASPNVKAFLFGKSLNEASAAIKARTEMLNKQYAEAEALVIKDKRKEFIDSLEILARKRAEAEEIKAVIDGLERGAFEPAPRTAKDSADVLASTKPRAAESAAVFEQSLTRPETAAGSADVLANAPRSAAESAMDIDSALKEVGSAKSRSEMESLVQKHFDESSAKRIIDEYEKTSMDSINGFRESVKSIGVDARANLQPDGSIYLHELDVPPAMQGQGRGQQALDALKSIADDQDRPIVLAAEAIDSSRQQDLNRFYLKNGFSEVGKNPATGNPLFRYEPAAGGFKRPSSIRGAINNEVLIRAGLPISGGIGGSVYGSNVGDTPEERALNAIRYGVLGFGIGSLGSMALSNVGKNAMLSSVRAASQATEGLPLWFQRLRENKYLQQFRQNWGNTPEAKFKDMVAKASREEAKIGGSVPENVNFYQKLILMPGRVRGMIRNDAEKAAGEIRWNIDSAANQIATDTGVPVGDALESINRYFAAKHAIDYNAGHPDYVDSTGQPAPASGISDADALNVINMVESSKHGPVLKSLFDDVHSLSVMAQDVREMYGLISPTERAELDAKYPNHVSFQRDMGDEADIGLVSSSKLSNRSSGVKRGYGSEREIADILQNQFMSLKDAIIRGERNNVTATMAKFFDKYPQNGITVRPQKVTGKNGNVVQYEDIKPNQLSYLEQVGGKTKRMVIEFNDPVLADAIQALTPQQGNWLLNGVGKFTGVLASLYTKYRPSFQLKDNQIRDLIDVSKRMIEDGSFKPALKAPADKVMAYKAVYDGINNANTPGGALYREAENEGAFTGGLANASRGETVKELEKYSPLTGKAKQAYLYSASALNTLTDMLNQSTFLPVYKRAREAGATPSEAALYAKDSVGINFDKKSNKVKDIGKLWAFVGPSISGLKMSVKSIARSPEMVGATLGSLVGIGMAIDKWNSSYDPEWKNKAALDTKRGSGFPIITGKDDDGNLTYQHLPIPQSVRPILSASNIINDAAEGREFSDEELRDRFVNSAIETVNVFGSGSSPYSVITPTIGDPLVDLASNRKYGGTQVMPSHSTTGLDIEKVRAGTGTTTSGKLAIETAKTLKNVFGADVSPEAILHLVRSYGGGPASIGISAVDYAGRKMSDRPSVDRGQKDIPLWGEFFGYVASDSPLTKRAEDKRLNDALYEQAIRKIEEKTQYAQAKKAAQVGGREELVKELNRAEDPQEAAKRFVEQSKRDAKRIDDPELQKIEKLSAKVEDGDRAKYFADKIIAGDKDVGETAARAFEAGLLPEKVQEQIRKMLKDAEEAKKSKKDDKPEKTESPSTKKENLFNKLKVERDENGRITGIRIKNDKLKVERDANGKVSGVSLKNNRRLNVERDESGKITHITE